MTSCTKLAGKVAIVTGSSLGFGEAIAVLLASRGASVTLSGRDSDRLKAISDKVVKGSCGHCERFLIVQGDLTHSKIRKELVAATVRKFGQLDILVSNAAESHPETGLSLIPEELFDAVININLKSGLFLAQEAVTYLEDTMGSVIFISSVLSSIVAIPSNSMYHISKAALDHLSRCLAVELGPKGIRVNTVNPSFMPTLILRKFVPERKMLEAATRGVMDINDQKQPLKGRTGRLEDVAEMVAFLASRQAASSVARTFTWTGAGELVDPSCKQRRTGRVRADRAGITCLKVFDITSKLPSCVDY